MCQRAGAPALAWATFPLDALRYEKASPESYASSPGATREFCPRCGSQIAFRELAAPRIDVNTNSRKEGPMELFEAMHTTFAAREYTGEELSDEALFEILDHARFAPSGGNRQGNRVIVIRDAETRRALAKLTEPAARRYVAQMQAGESPWNSISPPGMNAEAIAATPVPPLLTEPVATASVVLVFLVDLKVVASVDQDLPRVGVVTGASIYPFVWNILLATRAAGFGGTLTTLAVAAEPEMRALLDIPDDHAVCAVVPIGKPVKQLTKLRRLPVSEIAVRERFDGEVFSVD